MHCTVCTLVDAAYDASSEEVQTGARVDGTQRQLQRKLQQSAHAFKVQPRIQQKPTKVSSRCPPSQCPMEGLSDCAKDALSGN
jgi:hypothetical protein